MFISHYGSPLPEVPAATYLLCLYYDNIRTTILGVPMTKFEVLKKKNSDVLAHLFLYFSRSGMELPWMFPY